MRAQGRAEAEKLLERARHTEVMQGNLRQAIEQYASIAVQFRNTPAVAARALYQRGQCEEKLGLPAARATYQLVLTQYGGVPPYADAARARLVAKGWSPRQSGVQTRLLWDKATDTWGTTTADGRFMSFPDWDTGELGVRDLVAGVSRRVTNNGGYAIKGEVEGSAISPSGNLIAFAWQRWDAASKTEGAFQMRVVGASGIGERVVLAGKDLRSVEPQSWSPDEKWIAVAVVSTGVPGGRILIVAADGSQVRTALTLTDRQPRKVAFSPSGQWLAFDTGPAEFGSLGPVPNPDVFIQSATASSGTGTKVVSGGRLVGWTPDGTALLFARERDGAGELFLQPVKDGHADGVDVKITTVSDVGSALGVTTQGAVIYSKTRRVTDAVVATIDPVTGTLGATQTVMPIAAFGLGGTSGGVRYSPDGKYILFTDTPTTIVIRARSDGSERRVAPQMARVGRVEWSADSASLLIAGSTAAGAEGVYRVDLASGAATLVFATPQVWAFSPSRDGGVIYYRRQAQVFARELSTGSERTLATFSGNFGDMKVSPDGSTLAVVGLNRLMFVDTQNGTTRERFVHAEDSFDKFWGGAWTPDGRRFLTLASFGPTGSGPMELWSLPADAGDPVRQRLPGRFRGVRLSPEGTELATMSWENEQQVWIVENFLPSTTPSSGNLR
jgi:Tol biopolymer transport system component